jgi:hypothetical protein
MNESLTRRTFARDLTIGAVAAATTLAPAEAESDEPKPPAAPDQLLALLQARFPDRLNDEQWKQVRGKIEGQLRAAEELRKFGLKNADEPATVFAAYRSA